MSKIERIAVTAADRDKLERLVRDRNTAQKGIEFGVNSRTITLLSTQNGPVFGVGEAGVVPYTSSATSPRRSLLQQLLAHRAIDVAKALAVGANAWRDRAAR